MKVKRQQSSLTNTVEFNYFVCVCMCFMKLCVIGLGLPRLFSSGRFMYNLLKEKITSNYNYIVNMANAWVECVKMLFNLTTF